MPSRAQVLAGPYEVQHDEEWLAITRKLNCVFPLTFRRGDVGRTKLDMQDFRQWVKNRMEDRGAKPCEFSQTAPPHKPFDSVSNTAFSGSPRNPQNVSLLELLDLPYVHDNASDSKGTLNAPNVLSFVHMTLFQLSSAEETPMNIGQGMVPFFRKFWRRPRKLSLIFGHFGHSKKHKLIGSKNLDI
ncbi:hypothetical protein V6Z11_A03G000200 [Gossypium hirsutum]